MKKIIVFTFILFILAGCTKRQNITKYDYKYTGENELWIGEYRLVGESYIIQLDDGTLAYEGEGNRILEVTYKGDLSNLAEIKELEISYKAMNNEESMKIRFKSSPNKKNYVLSSIESGFIVDEYEIIEVVITIDGVKQIIELKQYK